MKFTKMQGLGNDYIYLDGLAGLPEDLPALARRMSDRHFGVGADGLICICPSQWADFRMQMYNADGSQGEMCGNGIRCLGKYVYDKGLTSKTRGLRIETLAGVRELELILESGAVSAVRVDMGQPSASAPITVEAEGSSFQIRPVSMGNPHGVIFVPHPGAVALERIGPALEHHPAFPGGINVEFVRVLTPSCLEMRVWERGSGETLACGTGACAALTAAVLEGLTGRKARVRLPGGTLELEWSPSGTMWMTGPAETVFEGDYPLT